MTFDIFDAFATNEKLEVVGVWHTLNEASGTRIKLARTDNPNHQQANFRLIAEHGKELEAESVELRAEAGSLTRRVMAEALAEGVLIDWENLTYRGKVLKYSKENAMKVLQHKDFFELVMRLASDITNYQQDLEDEQIKNS